MSDVRVLILPGRGNSGEQHWQSQWETANPSFRRVEQREWHNPHRDDWVQSLQAVISEDDSPVVLVAHSLGVSLVTQWASQFTGPVKAALLVAPSDLEAPDYPTGTQGFTPIALTKLPFETVVVTSTDDPKVRLERAQQFAAAWGARLEVVGPYGHLGAASGLGYWPFGAELLNQLIDHAVTA